MSYHLDYSELRMADMRIKRLTWFSNHMTLYFNNNNKTLISMLHSFYVVVVAFVLQSIDRNKKKIIHMNGNKNVHNNISMCTTSEQNMFYLECMQKVNQILHA